MASVLEELPLAGSDYPFPAPLDRYVFSPEGDERPFDIAGRTPVLALGSNAAPVQLRRKFKGLAGPIPVSRAMLFDHVVVYSAHFTRYAALPATLHRFPGGVTFIAITWLDQAQLDRMHESESVGVNYDYVELADCRLEHDGGLPDALVPSCIGAYVSRQGMLTHGGQPIRLFETASSGCPLPALTQPAALRFAHKRVAAQLDYPVFIQQLIDDEAFRRTMTRRLGES